VLWIYIVVAQFVFDFERIQQPGSVGFHDHDS
jgi:hypothetical protein